MLSKHLERIAGGAWVAASELGNKRGKSGTRKSRALVASLLLGAALAPLDAAFAQAYAAGGGTAVGIDSVALGSGAVATGGATNAGAVAIGFATASSSNGFQNGAVAIGQFASATGTSSTGGTSPVAIGAGAKPNGAGSQVAIGDDATASGMDALSIGGHANSTGSSASGNQSIAVGQSVRALGDSSIGMGNGASASGTASVAIGHSSAASGSASVAIGDLAKASAQQSLALGSGAQASGLQSISIGTGNVVAGSHAGAFGDPSFINGDSAYGIGNNNTIDSSNAFVLGNNVTVSAGLDGAVVLGNNSTVAASNPTASITIAGKSYNFAGATPVAGGVVSVGSVGGERQITNVAAGRVSATSTDALNGSQLFAASQAIETLNAAAVKYDVAGSVVNYNSITLGGTTSIGGGVTGGTTITNVHQGALNATSSDAVNGSQLFQTNSNVTTLGNTVTTLGTTVTNLGNTVTTLGTTVTNLGSTVTTLGNTLANIAGDTSTTYTDANGAGIRYVRTNEAGLAPTDSFATGQGATAVGYNATASAASGIAIGRDANAGITGSVALGRGSVSDRTIAQGAGAVPGYAAVQFNTSSRALLGAVSVGSATGSSYRQITNVADGTQGQDAATIAQLGALSSTLSATTTRYFHANSSAADSLSTGAESIAVGPRTTVAGNSGIGIGDGASVQMVATGGTAIGQAATVSFVDGLAIGTLAKADALRGVAIGAGATVSHADSVALGSNAITSTGSQTGYSAYALTALQNSAGEVSVGRAGAERQVTNVAGGSADTDAVNVAQLRAVATTANNSVQYNDGTKTTVTMAGPVSSDGGATGGTSITNLHQGALSATSTDAVNGSQLFQTNSNVTALGATVTTLGSTVTNLGNSVTALGSTLTTITGDTSSAYTAANGTGIRYVRTNETGLAPTDSFATGQGATAVGYNATGSAAGAVAIGRDSNASVAGGVALGQGSVSDRAITPGSGVVPGFAAVQYNTTGGALLGAISVGSATANTYRQITNIADGTQGQDAVSVSQLQALSATLSNAAQKYVHVNSSGGDSLSGGAESVAVGPRTVVNGDSAIGIGNGATVQMVATGGTAIGQTAYVGQADGIAVGTQASADALRGVAIGAGATVTHADSVALGAGAVTSVGSQTGYTAFALTVPQNSAGEVSIGRAGAERQLTHVAAGSADTDAVNASQLYAVQQQVSGLNNGTSGFFQVNNSANLGSPAATGSNAVAGGAGAVASGANSTALGNGANALANNAVAIGAGSVADRAGTVSVGSVGSERQVVNVAAGTAATDAANVGQLQAAQAGNVQYDKNVDGTTNYGSATLGNGQAPNGTVLSNVAPGVKGTDAVNVNQLNSVRDALNGRIDDVAKNAYAGVAAAMAVQMPASYVPGKTVMRVGAGVFKGQSAVGLSFRRTAENNAFSVSGGVGASRAGVAATVGAEWVFN